MDGENGEAEYGGDAKTESAVGFSMEDADEYWMSGMPIDKWLDQGFTRRDLNMYMPPSEQEIEKIFGLERHFASYYLNWQPQSHYYYCVENTMFQANPEGRSEGTYSKYASLDDAIDPYHYYFALLKFGIARATSDAAHEIREELITREEGVALVRRYDAEQPSEKTRTIFKQYCGFSDEELAAVEEKWRNDNLWTKKGDSYELNSQVS